MANYWMVRSERGIRELVERDGFIAIGFGGTAIGNLNGLTRDQVNELVAKHRGPEATRSQIASHTGQLYRFANALQIGDSIITSVEDRQYLIGKITSDYTYDESDLGHPHRRSVEWNSSVRRDELPLTFKNSLGSIATVFSINRHDAEIELLLGGQSNPSGINISELDPSRVDANSRRRILDHIIRTFPGHDFEGLVAEVLMAMGLEVEGHGPGADSGVDLIARHGPFGFEQIVVQVKNHAGSIGNSDIRNLRGTSESGKKLFVSARGYTQDAQKLADSDVNLELLSGLQLVDLLIEHYDRLSEGIQKTIPLRKVFLLDLDDEEDN